jgi:3-methyladenine DNA glycosylase AlkD
MNASTEVRHAIVDRLAAAGNPVKASQQQVYMKSVMPYHGVAAPDQRSITNAVIAERPEVFSNPDTWAATIRAVWDHATHREQWYAAVTIARHRWGAPFRTPDALPLFEHMARSGAWWDIVDEIAAHLVGDVLANHRDGVTPTIRRWITDESMWIRRVALLCQLHHGSSTDLDLLTAAIDANLEGAATAGERGTQDFFIRKAIGWALRTYDRTDPTWVRSFVDKRRERLAPLTIREALKHH